VYAFDLDPEETLRQLDIIDSAESLSAYSRLAWHIVEPTRDMIPGWHQDAVNDHLSAVSAGHINRLLINEPPGLMKSLSTEVFWPTWEWGPKNHAGLRYLCMSYSHELTKRDNRRSRNIIQSKWYQSRWGDRFHVVGDQNSKIRFDTNKMGWKIASSVGGLGTGERADRVIVDDPHNIKEGESEAKQKEVLLWFDEVLPTRLADAQKSAIIVIMQRVGDSDVSGHILEAELGYTHLMLPMEFEPDRKCFVYINQRLFFQDPRTLDNELLWPEKMTREVVERDKKAMGPYATAAQFQQAPAPRGGGMFKQTWWNFWKRKGDNRAYVRPKGCNSNSSIILPDDDDFDAILLSVDAAFKKIDTGSRVGMVKLGFLDALVFVLEDYTDHMTFDETCENIVAVTEGDNRIGRVLVEAKANGSAIVNHLFKKVRGIIEVDPEGGKEARGNAIVPVVKAGQVVIPEGAPWLGKWFHEWNTFPKLGRKNDRVDATSQGIIYGSQNIDELRTIMLGQM